MPWNREQREKRESAAGGDATAIPLELEPERILAGIPRAGSTLIENLDRQRSLPRGMFTGASGKIEVHQFLSQEEIVKKCCPVGTIYMLSAPPIEPIKEDSAAQWMRECSVLGRFAVSESEAAGLADAVRTGRAVMGFDAVVSSGYPLLRIVLGIQDNPRSPYWSENLGDVANADMQEYLATLAYSAWQWLSIYRADAKLIARVRIGVTAHFYRQFAEAFSKTVNRYGKTPRSVQQLRSATQAYFSAHSRIVPPSDLLKCTLYERAGSVASPRRVWEPVVGRLVAELIAIGKNEGFLALRGGRGFGVDGKHARTREIGSQLDELGSMRLMQSVCEEVRAILGSIRGRELESAWDGIGHWRS